MKLASIDREYMLRNAKRYAKASELRGIPLWGFVMRICGTGSSSSAEICRELGWNPDAKATDELPESLAISAARRRRAEIENAFAVRDRLDAITVHETTGSAPRRSS